MATSSVMCSSSSTARTSGWRPVWFLAWSLGTGTTVVVALRAAIAPLAGREMLQAAGAGGANSQGSSQDGAEPAVPGWAVGQDGQG